MNQKAKDKNCLKLKEKGFGITLEKRKKEREKKGNEKKKGSHQSQKKKKHVHGAEEDHAKQHDDSHHQAGDKAHKAALVAGGWSNGLVKDDPNSAVAVIGRCNDGRSWNGSALYGSIGRNRLVEHRSGRVVHSDGELVFRRIAANIIRGQRHQVNVIAAVI